MRSATVAPVRWPTRGAYPNDRDTPDQHALDRFDNVIAVHSFSKNFGLTGFRFGYVLGPADFIAHLSKAQLYTFTYPNSLVQELVCRYLALGASE